jgi:predicted DCC family thiol-disulfide oxidoreductase YuxK
MLVRLDRRHELAFLPLQAPEAEALLAPLPDSERLASWRLARPGGELAGRGAGAAELARTLRVTRPLARPLARVPPRVLDAVYGAVERRRGRLGRIVPDGPAPRRYP